MAVIARRGSSSTEVLELETVSVVWEEERMVQEQGDSVDMEDKATVQEDLITDTVAADMAAATVEVDTQA